MNILGSTTSSAPSATTFSGLFPSSTSSSSYLSTFGSNKYLSGTQEFLQSNSLIAKFAFLLLVIFLFVYLLRFGTMLLGTIFSPSSSPTLVNGMIDAKQMMHIPQDPGTNGFIPIPRSQNEREGLVFTWSVWIFVDDLVYRDGEYRHIFHKGNNNFNQSSTPRGMNIPQNAPGLYIAPSTNDLVVVMNTFDAISEEVVVPDIPLNKWVNVVIRVNKQRYLDIYINGRLTKRHRLTSVPRQNYGDVYVCANGGFSGYVSSLRYFSSALGTSDIQSIVNDGPNKKLIGSSLISSLPHYLSLRWYFGNNGV
jgi:hypothetical protein